ncbi:MAG TPA: BON domain-containing protein [Vicinamibacterales bacterium]|nr:BON domain-containing protein [Vicinamibacterales bacterium]
MLIRSFVAAAVLVAVPVPPGSVAPLAAQTRTAPQTDEALKDKIAFRLETNASVRKYDLRVKVANGVATLSGDVATAAQKAEAERLAKVDGISKVENTIQVDPNEDKSVADRIKSGMSKTGEKITDAWITTKVKWFFMGEDALKGSDINVDTANGVVTLKGTVASAAGKSRAAQLAKDTEGVTKVVDQLTIKP